LLTKLHGDSTWAPCGVFTEPNDHELFSDTMRFLNRPTPSSSDATPQTNGKDRRKPIPQHTKESARGTAAVDKDGGAATAANSRGKPEGNLNGNSTAAQEENPDEESAQTDDQQSANGRADGDVEMGEAHDGEGPQSGSSLVANAEPSPAGNGAGSASEDGHDDLFIHPLFLAPRSAHPDRNLGLPEQEAEDVRRLVQLYVQKQEEICRGARKLHEGLLKADRLRKTVLQWSKAEAHCGSDRDMSDGEDWYDKDEWGLIEDLKKGQDEEEEDQTTQQKKTRNRR